MRRLALALLLLVPALAGAQAYRWVDEQGKVHYTQTPPPKGDYGEVAPPPPSPGASETLDALSNRAREGGEAQGQAQDQKKAAAAEQQREQRCTQAKRQNARFQVTGRYYSAGPDGQREYMSAEQIDQKRAEAQAGMEKYCQ